MNKRKHWAIRLFLVFFTISVSVAVIPCGIINVRGLFGEIVTSAAAEDKEQETVNIKSIIHEKVQAVKGVNIFNVWFEILTAIICISFCADLIKLPRGETIVTLKVRMDH